MAVNWSLAAQPVNPLQALQAFGMAQQQQQAKIQAEQERAQRERDFSLRERQAGLQEQKFTAEQRNAALGQISQAAQDVLRRPEQERAAVWDSYMDQFAQADPSAAQFKGQYSEQALRSILARTGELEKFNKAGEVDYKVIPKGGCVQGFRFGSPLDGGVQVPAQTQGKPQPDASDIAEAMKDPQARAEFREFFGVDPEALGGQTARPSGDFR